MAIFKKKKHCSPVEEHNFPSHVDAFFVRRYACEHVKYANQRLDSGQFDIRSIEWISWTFLSLRAPHILHTKH